MLGGGFGDVGGGEDAEEGVVGGGDFLLGAIAVGDGPFHVGLSGGEPDFADEDVLDDDGFWSVGHFEFLSVGIGLEAGEAEGEGSVGICFGGGVMVAKGDGDGGSGIGPSPNFGAGFLLEDGAVRENDGEVEFGGEDAGGEEEGDGDECFHFEKSVRGLSGYVGGMASLSLITCEFCEEAAFSIP